MTGVRSELPGVEGLPIEGEILAISPDSNRLRLKHGQVPGRLEAGEGDFAVDPAGLGPLKVGMRVSARLVERETGVLGLNGVWPVELREDPNLVRAAAELREETRALGRDAYREIGDSAPQFALVDQDGRIVQAREFRGNWVVVNFIFTRCKQPNMCPASTAKMVGLQQSLKSEGLQPVRLVSITLDPSYDTPPVLREYALGRGVDLANFSLLTGPEGAVADLLRQFGVLIAPSDEILNHTLSTLLVSPEGRIDFREDGSRWDPDAFLARIRAGLKGGA